MQHGDREKRVGAKTKEAIHTFALCIPWAEKRRWWEAYTPPKGALEEGSPGPAISNSDSKWGAS